MKKLLVAVFACTLLAGLAVCIPHTAAAAEWTGETLREEYAFGEKLELPARKASVGGKEQNAVSIVTLPDGSDTTATSLVLDMAGIYTVNYNAVIDGKAYQTTEKFSVYDDVYHVGTGSEAVYEKHRLAESREGVSVRLAQSDTLTFSSILDVREAKRSETLVEFFITPDEIGKYDFERLIFTFTDVEDPSSKIRVTARASSDGVNYPATYFMAAGPGQPLTGYENNGPFIVLHVNNVWGAFTRHSFAGYYGASSNVALDSITLSVSYDAQENAVYANDTLIVDFDNALHFTNLWKGFTSGRVRLSVTADGYAGSTANFAILKLRGVDLTETRLIDATAPELTVSADELPAAKTGQAYPIPQASAKDDYSGMCAVRTSVWYGYATPSPVSVAIKDGAFTPSKGGMYAIVYHANDRSGNLATEVRWVEAREDVPAVTVDIAGDRTTSGRAGVAWPVAEATASGGSGKVEISVRVTKDGTEIPVEDGKFVPRAAGEYTVEYTGRDYIGQTATARYTFTASADPMPVFDESFTLPRYLISGSTYRLPAIKAYDYSSGTEREIAAAVTVKDGAGERAAEGSFVPTVFNTGDPVRLTFKAGSATITRTIPAIVAFTADAGRMRLNIRNYLIADGVSFDVGDETTTVSAGRADGSFLFAKDLLAEGFSLELRAVTNRTRFSAITVTLTDSVDARIQGAVSLIPSGSAAKAKVGETELDLTAGFSVQSASNTFDISYRAGRFYAGGAAADEQILFPSGYVYLSIAFEGASQNAAYEVRTISEQPITSAASDRIKPRIAVEGNYGGTAAIGDTLTVRRALAGDVLDPDVSFHVSVFDPAGAYATSSDGILLKDADPSREYTFTAAAYGQYRVVYTASDTFNGREQDFIYALTVEDREAPVITFEGTMSETAAQGEIIFFPTFTVSDNLSEEIYVAKFVLTPGGVRLEIPAESNSFKPIYTGVYRICVFARDEAGNCTLAELAVTVG